jgi:phage antirepressor YoqD-like protein
MNELELFNSERYFGDETMTVKEVSEMLNVSDKHIRETIKKLFPDILKNGITTKLNEIQVTAIKLKIDKNPHLNRQVEVKTNLEKKLLIKRGYDLLMDEVASLQIENQCLKIENNKMKPKEIMYDKFMDSEELYEIATVAKMIRGNVGRNKLKKWMKDNKIIMNNNDPYQNHKSHIRIIPKQTPSNKIYMQPFLTTAGVKYILDNYLD